MRILRLLAMIAVVFFSQQTFATQEKAEDAIIDVTQNLSSETPCAEENSFPTISNYDYDSYELMNDKFYPHLITTASFSTTCISAPSYLEGNWKTVNSVDLKSLVNVPCYNIDLSDVIDSGFSITVDDIKRFENKNGPIAANSIVVFFTGWSRFWQNRNQYINKFPTINQEAIVYLCDEKNVAGIAVDCPSIDNKRQKFDSQAILFSKGRFLIKNLSHEAKNIPPIGAKMIVAPLKFESCNETPARVFVVIEHEKEVGFVKKILGYFH